MESLANLGYVLTAVFGFGFVIIIHELGHFLFAKWAGVRVLRFSVGFGPVVLSRTVKGTEYTLCLIPAGGYVRMHGQEDGTEGAREVGSLTAAPPGWRALILFGGVLFNLVSSWLLLVCLAWYGMPLVPPVVGVVVPRVVTTIDGREVEIDGPAAKAGIRRGDRILAIDGHKTYSFQDLIMAGVGSGGRPLVIDLERGQGERLTVTATPIYDPKRGAPMLGIGEAMGTRISAVDRRSPGDLRVGETVVAVDGASVPAGATGTDVDDLLSPFLGRDVRLGLTRGAVRRQVTIRYGGTRAESERALGLPVQLTSVSPGSGAAAAGVRPGDVVVAVDGRPVASAQHFMNLIGPSARSGRTIRLLVRRAGITLPEMIITPHELAGERRIGVMPDSSLPLRLDHLPAALGHERSALAAAGLEVSDTLLALKPLDGDDDTSPSRFAARWLRGGSVHTVEIPAALRDRLRRENGAEYQLIAKLAGTRVLRTNGDGTGELGRADQQGVELKPALALTALGPELKDRLIAALAPDDWILGLGWRAGTDAAGIPVIEILRGAGPVQTKEVAALAAGTAVFLATDKVPYRLSDWSEAFTLANHQTASMLRTTLRIIPKFFAKKESGGVDASKSVSGPIGIFRAMKNDAEMFGFASALSLIAFIGLNLFMVNLLPIPLVDGGQLVFLAIEVAMRRPVPLRVQNYANYAGLALILALMLFALTVDVGRMLS